MRLYAYLPFLALLSAGCMGKVNDNKTRKTAHLVVVADTSKPKIS